ncbi:MAG: hypothetical protein MUF00_19990 [Gemmatimonadaceae bacterium]|jgi:hypothetical protein|nr:hypothetical protein [Gemmatimonadaceae bacterium]
MLSTLLAWTVALVPAVTQAQREGMDITKLGHGPNYFVKCFVDRAAWYVFAHDTCEGYPPETLLADNARSQERLAQWVMNRKWHRHVTPLRIKTANGSKLVTMRAITHPQDMPINELRTRGLVVMHILADPTAEEDKVFGIGGATTSALTPNFFMVVDPSDSKPPQSPKDPSALPLRRWHLFGIDASGRLVLVHSKGRLNGCGGMHATEFRERGTANLDCGTATQLSMALANPETRKNARALGLDAWMKTQRVAQLDVIGVWLTCGTGCCTAEMME